MEFCLLRVDEFGPAYKATPRQGDIATICDVILILVLRYIFNKRRHLQIPPRQVKINKRQQNFWSKLNQYKATHCMKIEYKATIDKFKLSWSNFDEKLEQK